MNRRKLMTIGLVCLAVLSAMVFLYSLQLSEREVRTYTICSYSQEASYDYIATLHPNTIYDDKRLLKPGETLYEPITHLLKVRFSYKFTCSSPGNINLSCIVLGNLTSETWSKTYILKSWSSTEYNGSTAEYTFTYTLNITRLRELANIFWRETGGYMTTYRHDIIPEIHVIDKVGDHVIDEVFQPIMVIEFLEGKMEITGMNHRRLGALEEKEVIYVRWVEGLRYLTGATTMGSATVLLYLTMKDIYKRRKSVLHKARRKYRDLIIQAVEKPSLWKGITIKVETIDDLAKISDQSGKPIIHGKLENEKHVFYILDSNIKYEFVTAEEDEA